MGSQDFTEDISYPFILFRLQNDYYAVNCEKVAGIMQIPEIETLPDAPKNVLGIFKFRDKVIPVLCLRSLFGKLSVEEEVKAFEDMINARKQDHVNWVKEFDRCASCGALFTLASDHRQCALGRWYAQYRPESNIMRTQLQKMEEPHRKLHHSVAELEECRRLYTGEDLEGKKRKILYQLEKDYMPKVLGILEEAKSIYKENRRTLLVVLDNGEDSFAVAVDEVLSVEKLSEISGEDQVENLKGSDYIKEIRKSARLERFVFVVCEKKLGRIARQCRA